MAPSSSAASAASTPSTAAANRPKPLAAKKTVSVEVPSRDLPPAPVRGDAARVYSNMMASTSG